MTRQITRNELADILSKHALWLRRKGGESANLQGANLQGANLRGANLQGANLYCANMRSADLRGADLRSADLQGANLQGANLYCANMEGANLRSANLRGANMEGAVGNMMQIKSAQIDKWPLTWTRSPEGHDWLQIGCQRHKLASWKKFSDAKIASMDDDALEWWRDHRETVIGLVKSNPAEPWGVVTKPQESK